MRVDLETRSAFVTESDYHHLYRSKEPTGMSSSKPRRGNAPPIQARGRGGRGRPNDEFNHAINSVPNRKSQPNPANRKVKLEFIPSISRSGGDDGQGDTLKHKVVQEEYWGMIQEKLAAHWDEFPSGADKNQLRVERESNILLLLRKLREGVLASQRTDEFALGVYETSFYLAVIFESPVQASSTLSHLPELYSSLLSKPYSTSFTDSTYGRAEALAVVSLIFHLSEAFPSQATYYRQLKSLECLCPPQGSVALKWVSSMRASINCQNYARFETLTRRSQLTSVIESIQYLSGTEASRGQHLVQSALCSAVGALRLKLRSVAWTVLRFSYREFTLGADTDTAAWLSRSLLFESVGDGKKSIDAEEWMKHTIKDGHAAKQEGSQGRWVLKR